VVDDIIQTVSDDNTANVSFTVEHGDLQDIKPVVDRLCKEMGARTAPIYHGDLAKVSVVGVGMRTHTGVAQRMFKARCVRAGKGEIAAFRRLQSTSNIPAWNLPSFSPLHSHRNGDGMV
jgi:aspartokinase